MKKYTLVVALLFFTIFSFSYAQEKSINYGENPVIDSDLDGLTDLGEREIFHTNPQNADTDGDGLYDGAEILNNTNPLDSSSVLSIPKSSVVSEDSWAWYTARITGLVAFILLYIVILFALTIRLPFLRKILAPIHALNIHRWLSVQALAFTLFHGLSFIFDEYIKFGLWDILIPFYSEFEPVYVGLGIISLYMVIILILTSYLKNKIPYKLWRSIHFLNILIYWFVFAHALNVGTDLAGGFSRNVFISANVFLGFMFLLNFGYKIALVVKRKINLKKSATQEIQQ